MRKSDKKLDNAIRDALTKACDQALERSDGFQWLTHQVNYNAFPTSLHIVCVYDSDERLGRANIEWLRQVIDAQLQAIDIRLKDASKQISFDTEQACAREHAGRWAERIRSQ